MWKIIKARADKWVQARNVQMLVKLRKELEDARQISMLAWSREMLKYELVRMDILVFEQRYKVRCIKMHQHRLRPVTERERVEEVRQIRAFFACHGVGDYEDREVEEDVGMSGGIQEDNGSLRGEGTCSEVIRREEC
jgi:hypothetical protein